MNAEATLECGLCRERLTHANRSCGLDLCDACHTGDLRESLAARGFAIEVETWKTRTRGDNPVDVHHTRVRGRVRTSIRPTATFTREHLGTRFRRWIGRGDLEVGDPLFDDHVWVETETDEHTRAMLSTPGMQDVIMQAIDDCGDIHFTQLDEGCAVEIHGAWAEGSSVPQPLSYQRVVASALHHLQVA